MTRGYNEYRGFIPASNPIDWAKLTGGLVKTITDIGESREAERQALDKLQTDNSNILSNTELGKSQTLNQLILSGSNDGRQSMMEWNRLLKAGQITPLEYKNRINNLMDSWSTFANTAKTFDQQIQEAMKRQERDPQTGKIVGSALDQELNIRLAQFGDLRNKKVQVDPNNGNFIIGELDENGVFDPSSIIDLRALSKPGNMIDNRVDLSAIVDDGTKGWEDWTIELGNTTITDALQNPAIQRARLDLANGILSNPRSITSVLTDNTDTGYDFYYNEKDLDSKLRDRIFKENELNRQLGKPELSGESLNNFIESEKNKLILLSQDDQGVYQPNLTNKQIEDAKQTVLDAIDSRLERKVELDEPIKYSGGGGGGRRSEDDSQENAAMIAGYKATVRAFGGDPDATISSGSWVRSSSGPDFGGLKQGYTYTSKNGGIEVSRGRDVVFFARTPKDLAQFVYNAEPAKASLNWEEARKMSRSGQSSGSNRGSSGIQW